MGSSRKPAKKNDRPIIRSPKKGSGGEGSGQRDENLNVTCPLYLKAKVTRVTGMRTGSVLDLDESGAILFGNTVVGRLMPKQLQSIVQCEERGYRYTGRVMVEDSNFYGQFERYTV